MDFHPDLQTDLIFQARTTLYGEQFHVTIVYQLLQMYSLTSLCECYVSLFYSPSQVCRHGVWPSGSGEVVFSCPTVRKMRPVQLTEEGRVRRVRGIAYP